MKAIGRRIGIAAAAAQLALAVAAVGTGPAGATSIRGSYAVSTAGSISLPASPNEEPARVEWSLGQTGPRRARGSAIPGRLVTATQAPYVLPCDQGPAVPGGTTTLSAIASRLARFSFVMTVDAIRGRGTVMLMPSSVSGRVTEKSVGCTGETGNHIELLTTFPAASILIPAPNFSNSNWAIRRVSPRAWSLDETRIVPAPYPEFWPATIVAKLRLVGSLRSLRSSCMVPAVTTFQRLTGVAAGRAYLKRAEFRVARISTAFEQGVPKGHLFLPKASQALACGSKLDLFVSLGDPPAGGGEVGSGRVAR